MQDQSNTNKISQATKTPQNAMQTPRVQSKISSPVEIIQRAQVNPDSLTRADIMTLHSTIGNREVARLLGGIIQRKAQEVMQLNYPQNPNINKPKPLVQKAPIQREKLEEEKMQLKEKRGLENISSTNLSSSKAHIYAQETDIHSTPKQEKHLPHVVPGRIKPIAQMKEKVNVKSQKDMVIQRAEWETFKSGYKWDELMDGVQWYSDSEGQMWFIVVEPTQVVKGNLEDYQELERQKKSWHEWNSISVEPYVPPEQKYEEKKSGFTIKDKIMAIATKNKTSGMWFAWGRKDYMIQWTQVGNVLNHALKVNTSAQGSGLYLAVNSWRSSTYAVPGAYLLIARLTGVPTIDIRNKQQMRELGEIGLSDQDLYKTENLTEMLFLYTKNGSYARLTATKGVELITDLNKITLSDLRSDYNKYGSVAKPVLKQQAKDYKLDIGDW